MLVSPVLLLTAVAIKLDSPGPVLFRQHRVGLYGNGFRIHKFRTMSTGSSGLMITTSLDLRVTGVGRFLRRTKIDELPQLVDVVMGSMSLVGPRPEVPKYVELWPVEVRRIILSVRPGITDPVTADLCQESELLSEALDPERHYVEALLPLKTAAYVKYVLTRSFFGDLRILVYTFRRIVQGAH